MKRYLLSLFAIALIATSAYAVTVPVNDDTPRKQYTAAAAQTSFVYDFFIFEDADLDVYVDDDLQVLDTDYTVSGENTEDGGNVVFATPLTGGEIVTILGNVDIARAIDLQQGGRFDPDDYNLEQDKNIVIMKQLKRDIDRKIGLSDTATELTGPAFTTLEDGGILEFDEGANEITATRTFSEFDTSVAAAASSASSASSSASAASASASAASASASAAQTYAAGLTATSTSSNSIGTGAKTFTTQVDKQFAAGQFIEVVDTSSNSNYMHGQVTSYSGTTLIIDSQSTGGSGTLTSWNIYVSGSRGATGATGPSGSVSDGDKGDITVSSSGAVWDIDANAVGSTEIANNAVTLAKLATQASNTILAEATGSTAVPAALSITANTFPGRSSTGNIAAKPVTDFALTVLDDADAATARTTLGITSGSYELISTASPSAASTVDFTGLSSTYFAYVLVVDIDPSANAHLYFRHSVDNGSTFLATDEYDYTCLSMRAGVNTVNGTVGTSAAQIQMTNQPAGGGFPGERIQGTITLINYSAANSHKAALWDLIGMNASGQMQSYKGSGSAPIASLAKSNYSNDVDAIRLLMDSGTMTGTVKLYGIRN